jgi:hypothetical protein
MSLTQFVKLASTKLGQRMALALVLLAAAGPPPARAQLIGAWSFTSGIRYDRTLPSARLEALGGMREAVPDENNEIHLLDFAGNLVGHLDDKPGSHLDAFTGPRGWADRTTPQALDQDFRVFPSGIRVNLVPESREALGGSVEYVVGSGALLVNRTLRQQFPLPVENPLTGSADGSLVTSDLRSPAFTVHYVRELPAGLAAGVEAGYLSENEGRSGGAVYQIDHDASEWSIRGSLAHRAFAHLGPLEDWVVGMSGRSAQTNIDGFSIDDVHNDVFTWDRPSVGASVHLLGRVGPAVKGGLDFRYDSFEGHESVDLNWSPQFALNPTEAPIRLSLASFEEGFRGRGFRTRWQLRPAGARTAWGAGFVARRDEFWQLPAKNVNSFMTAKSERLTEWLATGGGSYFLPAGRGLLAGELAYGWSDRDDRISSPASRVGASRLEAGVGAEFAPALPVVLRAGYRLVFDDGNRDSEAPEDEFTTQRVALGGGWRSEDARLMLDLGIVYDFVEPEGKAVGGGDGLERQDRRALTLQFRTLF